MTAEARHARPGDLPALTDLYNHYSSTGRHRLLVAVDRDHLLGYATTSPLREKQAYETSVEVTIYLSPGATPLEG